MIDAGQRVRWVTLALTMLVGAAGCGSNGSNASAGSGDSTGQLSGKDATTTGGSKVQLTQEETALVGRLEAAEKTGQLQDLEIEYWIGGGAPPPYSRSDQLRFMVAQGSAWLELNKQTFDEKHPGVVLIEYRLPLGASDVRAVATLLRETALFRSRFPEEEKPNVADILRTEVTLSSADGKKSLKRTYYQTMPGALATVREHMAALSERLVKEGTKRCLDRNDKEIACSP